MGFLWIVAGSTGAQAQQRPAPLLFQEDGAAQRAAAQSPLAASLRQSRPLTLNEPALRAALAAAPLESQAGAAPLLFALPLPDGSTSHFRVVESPVMEADLAAQFPTIKTYSGVGVDDPTATVRLDVTPLGFHAQVLSARGTVYIDPVSRADQAHYLSFYHKDMAPSRWTCGVSSPGGSSAAQRGAAQPSGITAQRTVGTTLRTYRLAVAATGEYTAVFGGTVAAGQAAIVTSINRVVGVYETELAVRLVLVANNASVVYTNAATDPYSNSNPSALLTQNQANLDAVIGTAFYDVGHVFTTGGGGLAGLGVVCSAARKAQGETGLSNPVGDAYDIDYVAHELGHQFGANHTFNSPTSNCGGGNRNSGTAYEPGSGSTIMAYAGICGSDDLQPHSEPFFHVASFEEIDTYLNTVGCGTTTATGNAAPVMTSLPANGKVLPVGTPFKLTAAATDANGHALTYNWEEYDRGPSVTLTAAQVAGQTPPLFRSFAPGSSPTRYFPRLADLIANTSSTSEKLPTVTRNLNFRVTVRDNQKGVNSSTVVAMSATSAAGPFVVTAPNTAVSWAGNSTRTISWDVAGTTAAPVSCALVNLRLSTDGGLTYPTLLATNTANDGTEAITVPNVATTTARVMVEAADNYFFDISNTNFTITATAALTVLSSIRTGATPTTAASIGFAVTFSGAITGLSASNFAVLTTGTVGGAGVASVAGSGTSYTVTVNTGTGNGTVQLQLNNSTGVSPTVSNVPFVGDSYTINRTTPTVSTTPVSNITASSATVGGNVTADGGAAVTERGIVFLVGVGTPTTSNPRLNLGMGTGSFFTTFAGLSSNTQYTVRAYAINSEGTSYGAALTFTTAAPAATATPAVLSPANTDLIATATPAYSGTAAAGSTVTVYVDGASIGTTTAAGGSFSLPQPAALAQGPHTVYATAQLSGQGVSANSPTNTFTVDTVAPTVVLSSPAASPTSTSPIPVTATFSEAVADFVAADVSVANGTVGSFSGSGTTYTFAVTPAAAGPVTVTVAAGVAHDAAGNASLAATPLIRVYVVPALGSVRVLYQNDEQPNVPGNNAIRPNLQVENNGTVDIPYSELTLRYWLTVEDFAAMTTSVNFAQMGSSLVLSQYVPLATPRQGALGYVEYSFQSGGGILVPGAGSGVILTSFNKQNWTNFDETDDYSYATNSTYLPTSRITAYRNGVLIAGQEPAAASGTTQLTALAANQNGAASTQITATVAQVRNTGNLPVPYSALTVRYWFTPDSPQPVQGSVDYAQLGSSNMALTIGQQGTQSYAELQFAAGLGSIAPMATTGDIIFRLHNAIYSLLNQANDYSFRPVAPLAAHPLMTVYLGGTLVYGTEPAGARQVARPAASASQSGEIASLQAYPNPFSISVSLEFALPLAGDYTLTVYDTQGRLVETLSAGNVAAGEARRVEWLTADRAAGLYLVRLSTAAGVRHLKLVKP